MARIGGTTRPLPVLAEAADLDSVGIFSQDFFANAGFRDASSDSDFNDHEEARAKPAERERAAGCFVCCVQDSDDTQATDFSQAQDDASAEDKACHAHLEFQAAVTMDKPGAPKRGSSRTLVVTRRP